MTDLPRLGEVLDDDYLRGLTDYKDGSTHRDEVYARIRNEFLVLPTSAWIKKCDEAGVWSGPVYTYEDLEKDPHIIETRMFVEQPHRGTTTIRTVRPPILMSATPPRITRGAPALGADTREVLTEIGYSSEQITDFAEQGVIVVPDDDGTSK